MNTYSQSYLAHHGILGQKWGVRRFQNEDGSLTPAGKKRYRKLLEIDERHEQDIKAARAAADREHEYMRKAGFLTSRTQNYKLAVQDLYAEDEKFRPIADETIRLWKKEVETGRELVEEYLKIANSKYGPFTIIGYERAEEILNNYKKYLNSNK